MERVASFYEAKADSDVRLPERATDGSAGYDFYAPESLTISRGEKAIFSTGVKVRIKPGWALWLIPRSGLGSKGLIITNTVGLIDSDFSGEIRAFLKNDNSAYPIRIEKGERYMQGVFLPYGITEDDNVEAKRSGGIGSTGR